MALATQETHFQLPHACSDHDGQQQLQEAIAASEDEFALLLQLQEVIALSDFAFAHALQLQEALAASITMAQLVSSSNSAEQPPGSCNSAGSAASTLYIEQESNVSADSDAIGHLRMQEAMVGYGFGQESTNDSMDLLQLQAMDASMLSTASGSSAVRCCQIHEGTSSSSDPSTSAGSHPNGTIWCLDHQDHHQQQHEAKAKRTKGKQLLLSNVASTCIASYCSNASNTAPVIKLCPICFELKTPKEIFQLTNCLHEFCISCMIQHVHHSLHDKRLPIRCAGAYNCGQPLTPEQCQAFLPEECYDAWRAAMVEAEIPEEQKVYCPFEDCSALLVNDEDQVLSAAECPFCNRLFCVQCRVPWHAGVDCSEYEALCVDDRRSIVEDVMLQLLAKERKWQRCRKCHWMVELMEGCHHIKCRCSHEFCYLCGRDWTPIHTCNS